MNKLNELLFLAQEGEHVEERTGLDLVLPETAELIFGTLAFLIVLGVLMKVAFPKIRASIEAREKAIAGDLEGAEGQRAEAHKLLEDYKAQLANARSEANKVIEEARQSAEQVRKDLIAKAEEDAKGVVARAQEQIEQDRTRTMSELRGEVADLAVSLAEKVVGRSLDRSSQTQLVDEYIKEVGSMSNGGSQN
jgi:F-type H+-transporting ATPase subunit b